MEYNYLFPKSTDTIWFMIPEVSNSYNWDLYISNYIIWDNQFFMWYIFSHILALLIWVKYAFISILFRSLFVFSELGLRHFLCPRHNHVLKKGTFLKTGFEIKPNFWTFLFLSFASILLDEQFWNTQKFAPFIVFFLIGILYYPICTSNVFQ